MTFYKYLKYKQRYLSYLLNKYHTGGGIEKKPLESPQSTSIAKIKVDPRKKHDDNTIVLGLDWIKVTGITASTIYGHSNVRIYDSYNKLLGCEYPPLVLSNKESTDKSIVYISTLSSPAMLITYANDRHYLAIKPFRDECYINLSDLTPISKIYTGMEITDVSQSFRLTFVITNGESCMVTLSYVSPSDGTEKQVTGTFNERFSIGRYTQQEKHTNPNGGQTENKSRFVIPSVLSTLSRRYLQVFCKEKQWYLCLDEHLISELDKDHKRNITSVFLKMVPSNIYVIRCGFSKDSRFCVNVDKNTFMLEHNMSLIFDGISALDQVKIYELIQENLGLLDS